MTQIEERLSINLSPQTRAALGRLMERKERNKTESVRDSIAFYDAITEMLEEGGQLQLKRGSKTTNILVL